MKHGDIVRLRGGGPDIYGECTALFNTSGELSVFDSQGVEHDVSLYEPTGRRIFTGHVQFEVICDGICNKEVFHAHFDEKGYGIHVQGEWCYCTIDEVKRIRDGLDGLIS